MNTLKHTVLFVIIIIAILNSAERGYGDWMVDYPGYPDMKERRILVLTNSCRMDPTGYRDMYLGDYDILLPANYPSQDPLYWQIDLNRVARVHSEDQAINGMSHTSSDGTSFSDRVKSYYTKSGWIAENIAAGSSDAVNTIKQWLMDYVDYVNKIPADDNSDGDGHRKNIMSANYKELGSGYAFGSAKYNHFWTQDFGGGTPSFDNPITSAAHFIDNGETNFMVTYKDPKGLKPQSVDLKLDGDTYNLSLLLGSESAGTYCIKLASADECRNYYLEFVDSDGTLWRYPEGGKLITIGEGGCTDQYLAPEDIPVTKLSMNSSRIGFAIKEISSGIYKIKIPFKFQNDLDVDVYNLSGKLVSQYRVDPNSSRDFVLNLKYLSFGYYLIEIKSEVFGSSTIGIVLK